MTRWDWADDRREDQRTLTTLLADLPGMAYRSRTEPHMPMEFVSDGVVSLTGFSAVAITSHPEGFRRLIHVDDRATAWAGVQAAIDAGTWYRTTYRILDANGMEKWVWDQGRGISGPDNGLPSRQGFMTDVTERVNAQQLIEHRLHALTRITASQTFDQPLETTLDALAEGVVAVTRAIACVVVLIDDEHSLYRVVGIHGMPEGYAAVVEGAYQAGASLSSIEAYRTRRPVQRTIREFMVDDPKQAQVYQVVRNEAWNTIASIPLIYRDRALGAMSCSYPIGMEPDEAEITFLMVIADQAAVSAETARLFAEVQSNAALEERQRLARELHDSVSQALFGIGLGARTARTLLDRDPAKVAEPLDYVIALAETGLIEMRALIFELRPDALVTEGLVRLLEQQAAALHARHGVEVTVDLQAEPVASLAIKEMLYRIAQETLHNTTRHAQARAITITLRQQLQRIVMDVADDGIGFDPSGSFPGHLGLRSMHERAVRQGASVAIESAPGQGTRVRVVVPLLH